MPFYPLRVQPGQDLLVELKRFVASRGLNSAFVSTCCGSLTSITLRFADKPGGGGGNQVKMTIDKDKNKRYK